MTRLSARSEPEVALAPSFGPEHHEIIRERWGCGRGGGRVAETRDFLGASASILRRVLKISRARVDKHACYYCGDGA